MRNNTVGAVKTSPGQSGSASRVLGAEQAKPRVAKGEAGKAYRSWIRQTHDMVGRYSYDMKELDILRRQIQSVVLYGQFDSPYTDFTDNFLSTDLSKILQSIWQKTRTNDPVYIGDLLADISALYPWYACYHPTLFHVISPLYSADRPIYRSDARIMAAVLDRAISGQYLAILQWLCSDSPTLDRLLYFFRLCSVIARDRPQAVPKKLFSPVFKQLGSVLKKKGDAQQEMRVIEMSVPLSAQFVVSTDAFSETYRLILDRASAYFFDPTSIEQGRRIFEMFRGSKALSGPLVDFCTDKKIISSALSRNLSSSGLDTVRDLLTLLSSRDALSSAWVTQFWPKAVSAKGPSSPKLLEFLDICLMCCSPEKLEKILKGVRPSLKPDSIFVLASIAQKRPASADSLISLIFDLAKTQGSDEGAEAVAKLAEQRELTERVVAQCKQNLSLFAFSNKLRKVQAWKFAWKCL